VALTGESKGASRPPPRGGRAPGRSGALLLALAAGGALLVLAAGFFLLSPKARGPAEEASRVTAAAKVTRVRGVTETEILFGMASPFTGVNRELGRAMKAGVDTAFAAINAAGGIHGRKLRLIALDDGYEPSRTVPVMRQLLEIEKVFAIVGSVGTPTAAVAIPYCMEQKAPFFGAFTGGDPLRKSPPDRYVFNFRPSYAEETSAAVRHLVGVRRIPASRVGVFAQDDAFGESGWRGAAAQLAAYGVEERRIFRAGYGRNSVDVGESVEALRARAGEIDAVVMVATYKAAATFIRKVRDAGLDVVFTNVSAVDANALAEELVSSGARHAENVVVTQIVPLPTSRASAVMKYRKALEEHAAGERPGFVSLEGWIVGNLLAEGLRGAGPNLDAERLVEALEGIRDLDMGIGAMITFGPTEHQGSHKVWGTVLQPDGSYRQIDLE